MRYPPLKSTKCPHLHLGLNPRLQRYEAIFVADSGTTLLDGCPSLQGEHSVVVVVQQILFNCLANTVKQTSKGVICLMGGISCRRGMFCLMFCTARLCKIAPAPANVVTNDVMAVGSRERLI